MHVDAEHLLLVGVLRHIAAGLGHLDIIVLDYDDLLRRQVRVRAVGAPDGSVALRAELQQASLKALLVVPVLRQCVSVSLDDILKTTLRIGLEGHAALLVSQECCGGHGVSARLADLAVAIRVDLQGCWLVGVLQRLEGLVVLVDLLLRVQLAVVQKIEDRLLLLVLLPDQLAEIRTMVERRLDGAVHILLRAVVVARLCTWREGIRLCVIVLHK